MDKYVVEKIDKIPDFTVSVPGSKSITNRALLLAALSKGTTTLRGVLFSDDSRVFMDALKKLGYHLEVQEDKKVVSVSGELTATEDEIYVGSAGTAARFLTAMLALSGNCYDVTSSPQMKKRPMRPLLEALEQLGVMFEYKENPYEFPFRILGRQDKKCHKVQLNIDESSQFLSALMMAGACLQEGFQIELTGTRSAKSYVMITAKMMRDFGVDSKEINENLYEINPGIYELDEYEIEPDVSAAAYFYAIAAITGGRGKVLGVHHDSTQGDIRFLRVLNRMGCHLYEDGDGIVVQGPSNGKLAGIRVDMSDFSDQTMTLAAIAPYAEGIVEIRNVEHIRRQESDRIHGIVTELTRCGICCEERKDGVVIHPGWPQGATIETYEDHRMAMSFAVLGCGCGDITISNPMCCKKTFENFFKVLETINKS